MSSQSRERLGKAEVTPCVGGEPVTQVDVQSEEGDLSRRDMAGFLMGAIGLLAISGCSTAVAEGDGEKPIDDVGRSVSALSGANFRWVDTLANLRTITGSTTNPVMVLGGYLSVAPPDGGGGLFYWDNTSMEADNGGTIVRPTAIAVGSPGRWTRIFTGALNVRWFGATGAGAADDQPAIQAAINYVAGRGGGTVYIPPGVYRVNSAIQINGSGVRLVGDNRANTFIKKSGADATTILFGGVQRCELSHVRIEPLVVGAQTSGAAVRFSTSGANGILLSNLSIYDVYCGIMCDPPSLSTSAVNEVTIRLVKMVGIYQFGIRSQNAINWIVTDVLVYMRQLQGQTPLQAWPPGSNKFGIWLDTWTEGWVLESVFVLGGERSWRFHNTVNSALPPPASIRFISCIADNGSVSCFYASAMHRCVFIGCWASAQSLGAVGFVMDSLNVLGVQWLDGEMMNLDSYCFNVISAKNFTISNSYFTAWGRQSSGSWAAINIAGNQSMSFSIVGNTFTAAQDADYGAHSAYGVVVSQSPVPGGVTSHDRYLIANNLGSTLSGTVLELNGWPPTSTRRVVAGNVT